MTLPARAPASPMVLWHTCVPCTVCGQPTFRSKERFCTDCWETWKAYKNEPWMREMRNSTERERYYQVEVAPRLVSLDALAERGEVEYQRIEPARSRTRGTRRRR